MIFKIAYSDKGVKSISQLCNNILEEVNEGITTQLKRLLNLSKRIFISKE